MAGGIGCGKEGTVMKVVIGYDEEGEQIILHPPNQIADGASVEVR